VKPDQDGQICPGQKNEETGQYYGASTFAKFEDLAVFWKNSHAWWLPGGSRVPPGLAVVADGADYGGPAPLSHHTIYTTRRMSIEEFSSLYAGLGWLHYGKTPK
jgi:hypothetical protein